MTCPVLPVQKRQDIYKLAQNKERKRMTTFIKTKFNISDDQTNSDKYKNREKKLFEISP